MPHLIVSKLHRFNSTSILENFQIWYFYSRSKLDPNRAIEDAAQGSPEAEAAYREFHATIRRVQVPINLYRKMFETAKPRKPWARLASSLTSMGRDMGRTAQSWAMSTREIGRKDFWRCYSCCLGNQIWMRATCLREFLVWALFWPGWNTSNFW